MKKSGEPILNFSRSKKRMAELAAVKQEENDRLDQLQKKFRRDMDRIAENGPIDRTRERREG